jgi:uncharacterized membrane protein YhaH (DUF805 family)
MEWMLMPYRRLYRLIEGRSSRQEYWMFVLLNVLILVGFIVLVSAMVGGVAGLAANPSSFTSNMLGAGFLVGILLVIPLYIWWILTAVAGFAVTIRRFHDLNLSGWLYLLFVVLGFIPLINFLALIGLIVMMCLPGTQGPNRYGEDPTQSHGGAEVFS